MSLFPISKVGAHLAPVAKDMERSDETLRWSSYDGITELTVTPVDYRTHDGLRVVEEVRLTHSLAALSTVSATEAAQINRFSTMSCLVPVSGASQSKFVCKTGIFSGDLDAAERLHAPLICSEAAVIGWYAACLARGLLKADPNNSPIFMTDKAPPYDVADFEAVKRYADSKGVIASFGADWFNAEFPWEAGAASAIFNLEAVKERAIDELKLSEEEVERLGGATSLLQLLVMEHPLLGKGIQSRFQIPFNLSSGKKLGASFLDVVAELNSWELTGLDLAPFFGAWCYDKTAPTFVSFFPTQYCQPGMLNNLFAWAGYRHRRVQQWLTVGPSRH